MKKIPYLLILFVGLFGIQQVATAQTLSTIAGTGTAGYTGDNGVATSAQLFLPNCVTTDPAGNVYVGVLGNRIRKIATGTNIITTYAGTGINGFSGDGGPATAATITNVPNDMVADAAGNIYFTDGNIRIRKITASTGIITTIAGTGVPASGYTGDGGPATASQLGYAQGMTVDAAGNIYYTEYSAQATVRKIDAVTGIVNTIAGVPGTSSLGFSGDGGPATAAHLSLPWDIAVDNAGNLFIADFGNNRIRKVDAVTGIITTFAGTGVAGTSGDGGPASAANIRPMGIIIDAANNIYFTQSDHRVRRIDAVTGIITAVAGTGVAGFVGNNGPATAAQLNTPNNLCMDGGGNIYIADQLNNRIRKIAIGCATVVAGTITGTGTNPACGTASSTLTLNGATASGVTYQWKSSTDNINWTNVGTSSTSYATGAVSTTTYYKAVVSCVTGTVKDSTAVYTLTVTPAVTPTAIITATPGNVICSGTSVTFSSVITNGGSTPGYQWKKGTTTVGTGTSYSDNALVNGDVITLVLTSSIGCTTAASVTSNAITMTVNSASASTDNQTICSSQLPYLWHGISVTAGGPNAASLTMTSSTNCDSVITLNLTVNAAVVPTVSITATPGTAITAGTIVTFMATPVNGGSSPTFTWRKNGTIVGSNSATYTDGALNNADIVSCTVHSSEACAAPDSAISQVTLSVTTPPVVCAVPSALITTDVNFTSVRFVWSTVEEASGYEYVVNQLPADPASGTFTTDTIYKATGLVNGDYYLHLRTRCGTGQYSPWIKIMVHINNGATGIGSVSEAAGVLLYPNPNNGVFTIEGAIMEKTVDLDILSYTGQVIYKSKENTVNGQLKKQISLPGIAAGAYLLRIAGKEQVWAIRFVVTK